jgi:hypothetical protein
LAKALGIVIILFIVPTAFAPGAVLVREVFAHFVGMLPAGRVRGTFGLDLITHQEGTPG